MDFGLRGKTVVVTGSTAGIGLATAMAFAREGARVVVNGRTQARVDQARAEISAKVPRADVIGVAADVGTSAGCEAIVAVAPQADVLINNAGIFEPKAFAHITDADWLRFFEMNVMSGVRLSRALLPGMMARGWGRIVFISSESALQIPAEMIHYGTTKTAQLAISRGLAESAAGTGVTVNSVLPGPTLSEGVGQFVSELARGRRVDAKEVEKGFFESMRPSSILKRFATPEEVANMVVYVASAAASATTGAALRVDGGVVRAIA